MDGPEIKKLTVWKTKSGRPKGTKMIRPLLVVWPSTLINRYDEPLRRDFYFRGTSNLPLWIVHLRPDSHDKIFRIAWVRRVGDRLVGKAAVKWYKMETWQVSFCVIFCVGLWCLCTSEMMQMMIKPKLASAGIVVNTITWFLDVACGLFSYSFKYDFKTISKENAFERAKLIYLLNFNIYSSMISGFPADFGLLKWFLSRILD